MALSSVDTCNLALAMLGADRITSFTENNKRARMCEVFYTFTRDYLLSKSDWTFARTMVKLVEVVTTVPVPLGTYVYQLPNDCNTPRDILPEGGRETWEVMGDKLYCNVPPETGVYLKYTFTQTDTSKFTSSFTNLLAVGIATKLCAPITQDKKLSRALIDMFAYEITEATEVDSNIGNRYKSNDDNPEFDSFINPESFPASGFENE